uniref:Uncharacterized protein n=1 Tax=Acrobeloides nanus TaxID=290746 RepID=A0A914CP94_9BILA
MPRLVKHIYDVSVLTEKDITHAITPEIINSYRTLHIYNDNLSLSNEKATPLLVYNFMKWHLEKFSMPPSIPTNILIESDEDL